MRELSLYFHIPFCVKKCAYCDFTSFPSRDFSEYFDALYREIRLKRERYGDAKITSIYFGGGTPSFVSESYIAKTLETVNGCYDLSSCEEITIEANPESVTEDKLKFYKSLGINRLSLGVQSLADEELVAIGRSHDALAAQNACETVKKHFDNYSFDLILGLPKSSMESLSHSIDGLMRFSPPHLSVYALSVEEGTPLYKEVNSRRLSVANADEQADLYDFAVNKLNSFGYERYEVSNFCRDKRYSKHNLRYWLGGDYLGFGLGACSLINATRLKNSGTLANYIKCLQSGKLFDEREETLTKNGQMSERAVLSLRTVFGVDKKKFYADFSEEFDKVFAYPLKKNAEYLVNTENSVKISERLVFVMNGVLSDFMLN